MRSPIFPRNLLIGYSLLHCVKGAFLSSLWLCEDSPHAVQSPLSIYVTSQAKKVKAYRESSVFMFHLRLHQNPPIRILILLHTYGTSFAIDGLALVIHGILTGQALAASSTRARHKCASSCFYGSPREGFPLNSLR